MSIKLIHQIAATNQNKLITKKIVFVVFGYRCIFDIRLNIFRVFHNVCFLFILQIVQLIVSKRTLLIVKIENTFLGAKDAYHLMSFVIESKTVETITTKTFVV